MEDQNCFLTKIKKLKLYIIKFNKDSIIKAKDYLVNCIIRCENYHLIIVITYDEYTFFANDGVQKIWTQKEDTFL